MKKDEPIKELGNRTWEELEVVNHNDGHLLFRDQIRKRTSSGALEAVDVRVRIPRKLQLIESRVACRAWAKQLGIDEDRDKDQFDELEQLCILEHSIRCAEKPYAQFCTKEELATQYDEASLLDLSGRIQALRTVIDPRQQEMTAEDIWHITHRVAMRGHLGPLTDIAGHEQPSCIVFMASQALRSPMGVAWLQSHGISTPERSPTANSHAS